MPRAQRKQQEGAAPAPDISADMPIAGATFRESLLSHLLARTSHVIAEPFARALKSRNVSVRQWRILGTLWDSDGMTLGEMAETIFCEQSSTTRMVDRLVAAGLVEKRPAPDDRRKVHLHLTPQGRAETAELVETAAAEERRIAARYGLAKTRALVADLNALVETLTANDGPTDG